MSAPLEPVGAGHRREGAASNPDGAENADGAVLAISFINCMRDEFVQVRRRDGTLLGCMPAFGESIGIVYTQSGQACEVMTGIIRGVIIPDDVDPRHIQGFTARTGARLDPPQKADGSMEIEDQTP